MRRPKCTKTRAQAKPGAKVCSAPAQYIRLPSIGYVLESVRAQSVGPVPLGGRVTPHRNLGPEKKNYLLDKQERNHFSFVGRCWVCPSHMKDCCPECLMVINLILKKKKKLVPIFSNAIPASCITTNKGDTSNLPRSTMHQSDVTRKVDIL